MKGDKTTSNNERGRVCILTTVHSAFDVRIFHKEARSLAKAGYDVVLIAQHSRSETVEGVKIIPLSTPRNRFFRILGTTARALKLALEQKASVYHFHDPELIPIGLLLKILTKARIIYDVHEDMSKQILNKEWLPSGLRIMTSVVFNFYEKKMAKRFDCIITVHPCIENNFKQKNTASVGNYPIISYFETNQDKPSILEKRVYTLIYCGVLTRMRGIKEIVDSLNFINPRYDVRLKLVGGFPDKNFEKEIKGSDKHSRVEHIDSLPHREAIKQIMEADFGLVCLWPRQNYLNSMPVKMFEYMAAGLPVIASDFHLWRKIIQESKSGVCVDPLRPKDIAKAVEYLIEHPEKAREMGENGRKAILERYNWENEEKKLLRIYDEITRR